jgi:immunity protein 52 of polymorphic toxin system
MFDVFSVKAGWGLREESVDACASRCARMLHDLSDIHPDFRLLQWDGAGQVQTRNLHELGRNGDLPKVFKALRVHNTSRTRIVPDGYELSARSTEDSTHSLLLRLRVGTGSADADRYGPPNLIELTIILSRDLNAMVKILAELKPILFAVIDAWNVDWGGLYSTGRATHDADQPRWRFSDAWAVYLAERFASQVVPPAQAVVKRHSNGGLLMMADRDVFIASNPAHVEAANAIEISLTPLRPWPQD